MEIPTAKSGINQSMLFLDSGAIAERPAHTMWLAPLFEGFRERIAVGFAGVQPVSISKLRAEPHVENRAESDIEPDLVPKSNQTS